MYQYCNYKLWSVLLIVVFLAGCPAVQVTDPVYPPDSSEIDTATYHIVGAGETLSSIAGLYGREYLELANWNGLVPPYAIVKGQRLRVDGPNENIALPTTPDYDDIGVPVDPYPTTPAIPTTPQVTHVVKKGDTLYAIARMYGQQISDLTRWNNINPNSYQLSIGQVLIVSKNGSMPNTPNIPPAMPTTPPVVPTTPVRFPSVPQVPAPNASGSQGYHVVLKGDTLYKIAKHYGFGMLDIAAWNGLQEPYSLQIGQQLRVTPPDSNTVLPAPSGVDSPSTGGSYHAVLPGETMYGIARKYGITVMDLADWNNLVPPYILSLGQQLRVTPPSTMMPSTGSYQPVGLSTPREHIVKPGETLSTIAKKYGIPFNNLAIFNKLGPPYNVYPSLKLKLTP